MRLVRFVLLLIAMMACTNLLALTRGLQPYSNVRVVPTAPVASQPLAARVLFDPCIEIPPASGQVSVVGNAVTFTITMTGPALCGTAPPPADEDFALGSLAPGNYTLLFRSISASGTPYPDLTTSFTVGPAPSPIPAVSLSSVLALLLAMGFGAYWELRTRRYAGTP